MLVLGVLTEAARKGGGRGGSVVPQWNEWSLGVYGHPTFPLVAVEPLIAVERLEAGC